MLLINKKEAPSMIRDAIESCLLKMISSGVLITNFFISVSVLLNLSRTFAPHFQPQILREPSPLQRGYVNSPVRQCGALFWAACGGISKA